MPKADKFEEIVKNIAQGADPMDPMGVREKATIILPLDPKGVIKAWMDENAAAQTKPRDAAWRKRKNALFLDGLIKKTVGETPDQFVGRLRELEDGMDPFHSDRRNPIMDDWHYVTQPTISFQTPVDGWRDERDKELWVLYTNGRFKPLPRSATRRRETSDE
tara:strand:- start:909 stop:1394 length:486 start_codon:yes stop_codon:yes gene_type:complete